ncbi:MAG: hypothetical protein Q9190_000384 [Brigantiaea leucoxantha]
MGQQHERLDQLPKDTTKIAIAQSFWNWPACGNLQQFEAFFQGHYHDECQKFYWQICSKSWVGPQGAVTSHQDIVKVAQLLSLEAGRSRGALRLCTKQMLFPSASDEAVQQSIELVIRLSLMLNVRTSMKSLSPATPAVHWNDQSTMEEVVQLQFGSSSLPKLKYGEGGVLDLPFEVAFTAPNLKRWSGVTVEWTACLADHLRHDHEHRAIRIFPYRQCIVALLKGQEVCNEGNHSSQEDRRPEAARLIPASVLKEALATLDLLFPPFDPAVVKFLKQSKHCFSLDGSWGRRRPRRLREFSHFRERLLEIHDIFHEPAPGWSQLWADRRNPQQFYTFWIALLVLALTIVFGLITSIAAIVQCWATIEALKIARSESNRVSAT